MNLLPPLPAPPGGAPSSDGDIDTLLSAYFRAELPDPWPAAPARARVATAVPRRGLGRLARSRLALAASVALLVSGALFRAGRPDEAPARPDAPDATPPSADLGQDPHASKPAPRHAGKVRLLQKKDATYIEAVEGDGPPMPDR